MIICDGKKNCTHEGDGSTVRRRDLWIGSEHEKKTLLCKIDLCTDCRKRFEQAITALAIKWKREAKP